MAKIKINWKNLLVGLVVGIAVIFSGAAFAKASRLETTKEVGLTAWNVGSVTAEGKIDTTEKANIVTDLFKAEGLEVDLDEEANATFVVHFYDEDKNYLADKTTTELSADYVCNVEGVEYARVELLPGADEDGEVSIFELPGYASMVTITIAK